MAVLVDRRDDERVGTTEGVRDTPGDFDKVGVAVFVFDVDDDADLVFDEVDVRVLDVEAVPVGVESIESDGSTDAIGDGDGRIDLEATFEKSDVLVTRALDFVGF